MSGEDAKSSQKEGRNNSQRYTGETNVYENYTSIYHYLFSHYLGNRVRFQSGAANQVQRKKLRGLRRYCLLCIERELIVEGRFCFGWKSVLYARRKPNCSGYEHAWSRQRQ